MSKPRMCEDCRYCIERDEREGDGKCRPPMPAWSEDVACYVKLKSVMAVACPCFKKNGGKVK